VAETFDHTTGAVWPGGWFIYENGQFIGPLSADDAFKERQATSDGKPRLVSRKGFAQWYPHEDLATIFQMTHTATATAEARVMAAESQIREQIAELDRFRKLQDSGRASTPTTEEPKVRHRQLAKSQPTSLATPVSHQPKKVSSEAKPAPAKPAEIPVAKVQETPVAVQSASKLSGLPETAQSPSSAKDANSALMHEYFLAKGRLRLGKLRNPWISGFLSLPLSLGAFWVIWIAELTKEVCFHAQTDRKSVFPAILALIPGLHAVIVYQLAVAVRTMEEQNRYKTVSPALAAAYSFFPPLAVTYLQDAVNRHWMLHVRHSLARKA